MAKGNLILGTLSGSIGDVTTYRTNGKQISRVRVRQVKNPQTSLQELQRTILRTVSRAYSHMSELCNHSFVQGGAGLNANRFNKLNMDKLRRIAAQQMVDGDQTTVYGNFNQAGDLRLAAMPYVVSEGSLPALNVVPAKYEAEATSGHIGVRMLSSLDEETATYDDVINALGAQRGDQLTAVCIYGTDVNGFGVFELGRVILTPADGDYGSLFLDANHYVNKPNPLNEDVMQFDFIDSGSMHLMIPIINDIQPILAGTVILSRKLTSGNSYAYSPQSLVMTDEADIEVPISIAIRPASESVIVESEKYLDNAQNLGETGQIIEPISPTGPQVVKVYETIGADTEAVQVDGVYQVSPSSFRVLMSSQAQTVVLSDGIVRGATQLKPEGCEYSFEVSDVTTGTVTFDGVVVRLHFGD